MRIDGCNLIFAHHLRLLVRSQHERDVGTVDIGIEQSDSMTHLAERDGEIHGKRRFADPALARPDGDNGVDARKRLRSRLLLTRMMGVSAHVEIIREATYMDCRGQKFDCRGGIG